ncbi:MAG: VWA domain-containing protein [Synergistaceae bacterium]|nr:VWA domain-containing protein [Synergistaceae bacterium]
MRILNNLPALHAFTSLNKTNKALQKTINALSTGLRINSSADDAAGFAISERMRSQISGLDVAVRNTQDGISLLQTAEGALGQTNSMLQRMMELAIQASSDSLTSQDRSYLQLEIDELKDQIDRIAGTTQFNKKRILDGSSGALWSSDDLNVKAKIHGGLVTVDEFGQKVNHEGNFRIEVSAEPGLPQVQKSNIMHFTETITSVENIITEVDPPTSTARVVFVIDVSGSMGGELQKVKDNIASFKSKIEAGGVDSVEIGICTYGTNDAYDPNFVAYTYPDGSLWSSDTSAITTLLEPVTAPYGWDTYNYYAVQKAAETYNDSYGTNRYMILVTDVDHTYGEGWTAPIGSKEIYTEATLRSALESDPTTDKDNIKLSVISPNPDRTSEFYNLVSDSGGSMLMAGTDWSDDLNVLADDIAETTETDKIIDNVAESSFSTIGSMSAFYNVNGVSLVSKPQTLTITQGNGNSTSVTLYETDTLQDVADKINSAIADGLGQAKYTNNREKFCTISDGTEGTSESVYDRQPIYDSYGNIIGYDVYATMLVRSAIPGKDGELYTSPAMTTSSVHSASTQFKSPPNPHSPPLSTTLTPEKS